MKLTTLFLFLSVMAMASGTYGQVTKFDLNVKELNVIQVFDEIERVTEFGFLFKTDQLDLNQHFSIDMKNANIDQILIQVLDKDLYKYTVIDRNIVITRIDTNANQDGKSKLISGKVTDSSGAPLPGASVVVKGTTNGVIIDNNGNYSISDIPKNASLQFSFVGMKTQEIAVNNQTTINIVLQDDVQRIDEMVVVGYGTQRKGNITGSVSNINTEELNIAPIANVTNALSGQLPGLITKQNSGQPGDDSSTLSIRGLGSPLIIVDGIESDLSQIDQSQIESVSILKDGSASIYGARAGNGVMLVTTKRGKVHELTVSANASLTMSGSIRPVAPMSSGQRAELANETYINQGLPMQNLPYTSEAIKKYLAGTDPNYLNTDWYDAAIRRWAPEQKYSMSVSGGNEKIKYYGSFGHIDQQTIVKTNGGDYARSNFLSNVDVKLTDNLSLSLNASLINDKSYFSSYNTTDYRGNLWSSIYWSEPKYPLHLPDPTKQSYGGMQFGNIFEATDIEVGGYALTRITNTREGGELNYEFKKIKGLKAKAFISYLDITRDYKNFTKQQDFYTYDSGSNTYSRALSSPDPTSVTRAVSYAKTLTQQYSFSYENIFNKIHKLSLLALYEAIDYNNSNLTTARSGYVSKSIDQLFAGSLISASNNGFESTMGRVSWLGRLNYNYNDRYLLESILRYDASAKFSSKGRWGLFPSVSIGWVISNENFLKSIKSVDNVKIRASYGKSGDDSVGNFQYLSGFTFDGGTYLVGNQLTSTIVSTGLANPDLTWEKISNYNGGMDFSFLNHKIFGSIEAFYHLRDGIPGTQIKSLPVTFGATLPLVNLNSVDTKGFEVSLGTAGKLGSFSYDLRGNISSSLSKWRKYDEPVYTDPDQKRLFQLTGQAIDRRIGYVSDGLFTSQNEINTLPYSYSALGGNSTLRPGDVKYKDINNDKVLDWRDQKTIGKGSLPHTMYGITSMLRYKNFELNLLFQGAFAYTTDVNIDQTGDDGRIVQTVLLNEHRWTESVNNRNSLVPRPGGSSTNIWYSDYRNHSTSYIRMKSASVGYLVPNNLLSKIGIKKTRIFFAGTNLFTISSLKKFGVDPEIPDGVKMGNYYPLRQTCTFGLDLLF